MCTFKLTLTSEKVERAIHLDFWALWNTSLGLQYQLQINTIHRRMTIILQYLSTYQTSSDYIAPTLHENRFVFHFVCEWVCKLSEARAREREIALRWTRPRSFNNTCSNQLNDNLQFLASCDSIFSITHCPEEEENTAFSVKRCWFFLHCCERSIFLSIDWDTLAGDVSIVL